MADEDELNRNDSRVDEPWKADESGRSSTDFGSMMRRAEEKTKKAVSGAVSSAASLGMAVATGGASEGVKAGAKAAARLAEKRASEKNEEKSAEEAERDGGGGFYRLVEGKVKKKFSVKAPAAVILTIVIVTGVALSMVQSIAPIGYKANMDDDDNTQRTGYNKTANTFVGATLEGEAMGDVDGGETANFYDDPQLSEETKASFEVNDIYYVEVAGTRGLAYEDPISEEWMIVTANSKNAESLAGQSTTLPDGESITFSEGKRLDDAYDEDVDFANDFDVSLRSIKGHSAGWYDESATLYNNQISNTRNKFIEYSQETPEFEEVNQAVEKNGGKVEIEGTNGVSSVRLIIPKTCTDEDGNEYECDEEKNEGLGDDGLKVGMSEDEVKSRLTARAKKAMMADSIQDSTDESKTAKAVAAVDAVGTAALKIQLINAGTGFFEAVDKAKSGDGGGVLNAYMRKLSEPGETKWLNDKSEWETVEGKENVSAIASQAWNQVAGNDTPVSADDPMVKTYNMDTLISDSYSYNERLKNSGILYSEDGVEKYSATTQYSDAKSFYETEGSGPSGGLFSWITSAIKTLLEAIFRTYEGRAEKIAEVSAKRTKEVLDMDIEEATGESQAYALLAAGDLVYGQKAITISGRTGTKDQLMAQWRETQEVIAREAEVDRSLRSPFDVTSKNTFLGSIVHKTLPIVAKMNTPLRAISGSIEATLSSIQSIVPIAGAAADENNYKESLREDCPTAKYLETAEGVMSGSAFCFQKAYQDPSTFKTNPVEVYKSILYGVSEDYEGVENFLGVDKKGNPIVNPDGEYATWIVACSVKKSQWGYLNGQSATFIQDQMKGKASSVAKSTLDKGLEKQSIDEVEKETYDTVYDRAHLDWTTGLNCMGGRDGSLSRQVALYAQFNTYENILEVQGNIDKAAQVGFLEDYYYQKYPMPTTWTGVLAEYSGLSEDEVELALGVVEYYDFIAKYEPEELGPVEFRPVEDGVYFEETTIVAEVLPEGVVFKDFTDEGRAVRREVVAMA